MNQYLHTFFKFPQLSGISLDMKHVWQKKIFEALKRMPNDRSSGNGGLIKAFLETLLSEVKTPFSSFSLHSLGKGQLWTSQSQAITKLIEKKTKTKY